MNASNTHSESPEFKLCAGRDCNQKGIHELEIKFIHRTGWFCEFCKNVLLEQDLGEVAQEKNE